MDDFAYETINLDTLGAEPEICTCKIQFCYDNKAQICDVFSRGFHTG